MADRIKGITIKIGGDTTELNKSLKGVNSQIKTTQSELRDVDRLLKLDPTNTNLLKQKQELLAKAVSGTKDKLDALKAAESQVQEQVKKGETSEEQYRALQREITETEQKLKDLESQAGKSNAVLSKIGTVASDIATKTRKMSTVAGGALVAIGASAVKAGKNADELNTLSKQTGLTTAEIQKFQYASELIDVDLDTLTGSLAKLVRNMNSAKNGSKNTQAAFDALGISITDQNGVLRNNKDVFYEAINALSKIEDETQRDAYAMQIFGKSAQDLNPLILGGSEQLERLGQEAENAGLIMSQDAIDGANEFNDAIDKLKSSAAASFGKIAGQIAQTLIPVMEKLSDILSAVLGWFANLSPTAQNVIIAVLLIIAAISPLASVIGGIITVIQGVSTALAFLAANPIVLIIGAIAALVAGFVWLWNNCEGFRQFWIDLWDGICSGVSAAWEWIKTTVIDVVAGYLKTVWDAVSGTVISVFTNIYNFFVGIWDSIKQVFSGIIDFFTGIFTGDWSKAWNGIKEIFSGIWNGIKTIVKTGVNFVIGAVNGLIDGLNLILFPLRAVIMAVGSLFGAEWTMDDVKIPNIPYLAKGGIVAKGSAIVGEAGPELLTVAGGKTQVTPLTSAQKAAAPTAGATYHFEIETLNNFDSNSTANDLCDMVMERIEFKTQRRGACV